MRIFSPADVLLPKEHLRKRFAVVACDQYTSQPEYWEETARFVGDAPSALKIIVPESSLESRDILKRIENINDEMERYLDEGVFEEIPNSYVYVERTLRNGKARRGLIGKLDLLAYDYSKRSKSPVRATEATVCERIPPRVAVRERAAVESPHVMILIDDPQDSVFGALQNGRNGLQKLYDFPLMMNSGSVAGWRVDGGTARAIDDALEKLADPDDFYRKYGDKAAPLVFAVGDGNHSLACAKELYTRLCAQFGSERMQDHPARYALVEIVNLHDASLQFEPVHRIVYGIDRVHFAGKMEDVLGLGTEGRQHFLMLKNGRGEALHIGNPTSNLTVGSLQSFIDDYMREFGGRCDYIHGDDVLRDLSCKPDTLGFIVPPIDKADLFETVIVDGSLTRKTFSMGNADDKRFYLECRRIR